MKALDRGQTPTITPDLTDELFIVQVDADGVARDGRASIGTLLEATASSQFLPWRPSTAYTAGTFVSFGGILYVVSANHTSAAAFDGANLAPPEFGVGSDVFSAGGEVVPPRLLLNGVQQIGSGDLWTVQFVAKRTETITHMSMWSYNTAAGATPTICRFGVFTVDAVGDLTPLTSIANDTSIFSSTFTEYKRALTTPWSKVAGQRYALGVMVATAATMPGIITTNAAYGSSIHHALNATLPAILHRGIATGTWPTAKFTPTVAGSLVPAFRLHTS